MTSRGAPSRTRQDSDNLWRGLPFDNLVVVGERDPYGAEAVLPGKPLACCHLENKEYSGQQGYGDFRWLGPADSRSSWQLAPVYVGIPILWGLRCLGGLSADLLS